MSTDKALSMDEMESQLKELASLYREGAKEMNEIATQLDRALAKEVESKRDITLKFSGAAMNLAKILILISERKL